MESKYGFGDLDFAELELNTDPFSSDEISFNDLPDFPESPALRDACKEDSAKKEMADLKNEVENLKEEIEKLKDENEAIKEYLDRIFAAKSSKKLNIYED
jgi:hypothetical protein